RKPWRQRKQRRRRWWWWWPWRWRRWAWGRRWWPAPVKSGLRLGNCCMIALEEKKMGHLTRYLGNLARNSYNCLGLILINVFAIGSAERAVGAAAVKQKTFSSPEEGVKALIDAARKNDTKGILEILGADAKSIIESGDPVADNEGRQRFVKSYDE